MLTFLSGYYYSSLSEFAERFANYLVEFTSAETALTQINNAATISELLDAISENADILEIEDALHRFHSLDASSQKRALSYIYGRQYTSLHEFSDCFKKAVYSSTSSAGSSSSSGGGGLSISDTSMYYSITSAAFKDGIITLDLCVSRELIESDILFAAIYEEDTDSFVTVAEVDLMRYYSINGYRTPTVQFPCNVQKDIYVKLIGLSSLETLKPFQPHE